VSHVAVNRLFKKSVFHLSKSLDKFDTKFVYDIMVFKFVYDKMVFVSVKPNFAPPCVIRVNILFV